MTAVIGWVRVVFLAGLLVWASSLLPAHAQEQAMRANEDASIACRYIAHSVRTIADSRDQGGSLGHWLSVSPDKEWKALVIQVWSSDLSATAIGWKAYTQCMLQRGAWEIES